MANDTARGMRKGLTSDGDAASPLGGLNLPETSPGHSLSR